MLLTAFNIKKSIIEREKFQFMLAAENDYIISAEHEVLIWLKE